MTTIRSYTTKEAAELLSVHECTLRKLLREGQLRGFKINTHWRVTEEALKEFSAKNPLKKK